MTEVVLDKIGDVVFSMTREEFEKAIANALGDDVVIEKGGPGSGHFGHAGRPGKVGGSASGKGGVVDFGDVPGGNKDAPWFDDRAHEHEQVMLDYGSEVWGEWAGELSGKELNSFEKYALRSYWEINRDLRRDSTELLSSADNDVITYMDSAINKHDGLEDSMMVYRGTDDGRFLSDVQVGDVYKDKGFISTSMHKSTAMAFSAPRSVYGDPAVSGTIISIKLPKGTKAAYIPLLASRMNMPKSHVTGLVYQHEIILPRDTLFKVISISVADKTVSLEVING